MAKYRSQLNRVKSSEIATAIPMFPVSGFDFVVDTQDTFTPYIPEAAEMAGFPMKESMPKVSAFFYCSNNYMAYLDTLEESGLKHPAQ